MGQVFRERNGVKIKMYNRNEHPKPHVHIEYSGFSASIAIEDFELLVGALPSKQLAESLNRIARHREKLLTMWENRMVPGGIYTIED